MNPEIEFENEYTPDETQRDRVWVLDGRGDVVELEVADDAADD